MNVHQPVGTARPEVAGFLHSSTEHASHMRLDQAVNGLRRMHPEWSASQTVTPAQRRTLTFICIAGFVVWIAAPVAASRLAITLLALAFAMVTLVRLLALWQFVRPKTVRDTNENDAVPESALPPYTLLVPLYGEAGVAAGLVSAMQALDYPNGQLEILFLTEADDHETRAALAASGLVRYMQVITVPNGAPRTKPRALNYGLTFARGEFVGISDAEDVPDPGQLRAAVSAFRRAGPETACLQARLSIYNPGRNVLTRGIMAQTPETRPTNPL